MRTFLSLLVAALVALPLAAQEAPRPLPHPVPVPPVFERAIESGTRTATGEPGPAYWQNEAAYDLDVTLEPDTRTVRGSGSLSYTNHSPTALAYVVLKLRQNVHAEGALRNRRAEITGGVTLDRLALESTELTPAEERPMPGQYRIDGTTLGVVLPEPLEPGATLTLGADWHYRLASVEGGTFREGTDGEVFYVGYWYPQFAVYDDVRGWHTDPYLGNAEHYMPFADYRVRITAPEDVLISATGALLNPREVYTERTLARLRQARASGEVVHVVNESERGTGTLDAPGDLLTWEYEAARVRDFAFAGSEAYVWDATRALADGDDPSAGIVDIHAYYRPGTAAWERSAEFSAFAIEHLSETFWPYPWPHMTAVEGIIGGGMEYPMMTLIGGDRTDESLFGVTYHEIAHMWFPMMVAQDEKTYTWMDEGLTSFNTNEGRAAFFDGSSAERPAMEPWARERQAHYRLAGTGYAVPSMRHGDRYPLDTPARGVASYSTPAVVLHALRDHVGDEAFWDAYRAYGRAWAYKHPYPYDLFNHFETSLGMDLDWLWTPHLFDTWTVDVAITGVETIEDGIVVTVEDQGMAPMPVRVTATYAGGRTETQTIAVGTWLEGVRSTRVVFSAGDLVRVDLPTDTILDLDPSDNSYRVPPRTGPANGG